MAINSESYLFGITIMGNWKEQPQEIKKNTTEVLLKREEKSRFISEGAKMLKTVQVT